MARRRTEVFSISFLDCICCGFGAVVLFYTIISAQSGAIRTHQTDDLRGEVRRLEEQVTVGTRNLTVLHNTFEKTEIDLRKAAARSTAIISDLEQKRLLLSSNDATSIARREHIAKLKSDVLALEQSTKSAAAAIDKAPPGERIKAFRKTGGERRYITGLTLTGRRILVLVDRSASMMDDDVVNVIRLRNMPESARRAARKWRRAVDTVGWLITQLPAGAKFQIYGFNTQATPVLGASGAQWLDSGDARTLDQVMEHLRAIVPQNGTSLINAFKAVAELQPAPDQVVLITDGLPTQGVIAPPLRKYIDANGRARLFDDAVRALPPRVRVDVVLLPMKGDVPAPYRFWQLAKSSGGTFTMPSRDWP
ncbi:MAG: VWA domain-containing protein [Steroidobacteraceae bacterium]